MYFFIVSSGKHLSLFWYSQNQNKILSFFTIFLICGGTFYAASPPHGMVWIPGPAQPRKIKENQGKT